MDDPGEPKEKGAESVKQKKNQEEQEKAKRSGKR